MKSEIEKKITPKEWDNLIKMVERIYVLFFGDEEANEIGLKREHDEMHDHFESWKNQDLYNRSKKAVVEYERFKWLIGILGTANIAFLIKLAYDIIKKFGF